MKYDLPQYVIGVPARSPKYFYFRLQSRGQPDVRRRLPNPLEEGFAKAYQEAKVELLGYDIEKHDPRSVNSIIRFYREQSVDFSNLKPASVTAREKAFSVFSDTFGKFGLAALEPKHIRVWRDRIGKDRPAAANRYMDDISALMKWAVQYGHLNQNPCREIESLKRGEGYEPWPDAALTRFMTEGKPHITRVALMCYYSMQRVGDVIERLTEGRLNGSEWIVRQEKSGNRIIATLPPQAMELLEVIRAERREKGIIDPSRPLLENSRGAPWTRSGFSSSFKTDMARLGLDKHDPRLVVHGLRATAATHARQGGSEKSELQAALGHASGRMSEHYARRADMKSHAASAAARLHTLPSPKADSKKISKP